MVIIKKRKFNKTFEYHKYGQGIIMVTTDCTEMMLEGQIKQIFHPRKQPTFNITEIQKCTSSVRFIFELFVVRLHFFMSITRRLHF